eukprot:TRINITY_DN44413_c0_g1_i1.p1 TRINITY_DN44413_c0_g1~~TRINITY_DN44413_c0_g1_i1.p1  ORF type:complete len:204 (+),score=21.93 TRINITY_DN44413_c0_g1_i1:93-704(+)
MFFSAAVPSPNSQKFPPEFPFFFPQRHMTALDREGIADVLGRVQKEGAEGNEGKTTIDGRPLTEKETATQFVTEDAFEVLKVIRDPEHKDYTLGDLGVVRRKDIAIDYTSSFRYGTVTVTITPTVPHCHLTPHIALCVHERLLRYLPPETRWKLVLKLTPNSHNDLEAVTKQINDKERVIAGLENKDLLKEILKCTDDEICCL